MKRIDSRTVELTEDEELILDTVREEWDEKVHPRKFLLDVTAQYGKVVQEDFVEYAVACMYDGSVHGWPEGEARSWTEPKPVQVPETEATP